jgi:hypothetical protein
MPQVLRLGRHGHAIAQQYPHGLEERPLLDAVRLLAAQQRNDQLRRGHQVGVSAAQSDSRQRLRHPVQLGEELQWPASER